MRALWHDYVRLEDHKALAIAGDPNRAWVGGAVGGFDSRTEAQQAALAKCSERRRERRFQTPCRLYAIGKRIVWKDPGLILLP